MSIITLTSDMGIKDFYLASIKGSIYKALPEAKIVDISHHIMPFDIAQAAFIVKNTYPDFPENTIHIISVDPEPSLNSNHIVIFYSGQFFIGNDNGMFSLLFDEIPDQIWKLTPPSNIGSSTFPSKSIFVWAASMLAKGAKLKEIGERIDKIRMRVAFRPVVEEELIKGTVIFIDGYGNVMTNIDKTLFEKVRDNRDFTIYFRGETYGINKICKSYNEVPPGEKLAIFGAGNFLEIAINKGVEGSGGGANKLFGIKLNDIIRIEFK
jgi:S-adenosylmethionine hydrolase